MPETKEIDQAQAARASLDLAFTILGQVGALTLISVFAPLALGLWLDKLFATRALFTLLFLFASFPATLFVIYRVSIRAVTHIHTPKPQDPLATDEEELTSDKNTTP